MKITVGVLTQTIDMIVVTYRYLLMNQERFLRILNVTATAIHHVCLVRVVLGANGAGLQYRNT